MTDTESQTVVIPIEFPDPDPLPSTFIDATTTYRVILLGVYELPEDADEEQEHRCEIEAKNTLYSLASSFVREGETAEVELVMGHGLEDVPSSFAEERDVDALLIPNPLLSLGRILIPIRDEEFAEPFGEFVSTLEESALIHTSLLHVTEDDEAVEEGERFLGNVKETLVESGFPLTGIDTEVVVSEDPSMAISNAARGYDLIIMGETRETGYEAVFGEMYESVADRTDLPILVIRE
jgi:nucleotide-binding universal stress UspA family protein